MSGGRSGGRSVARWVSIVLHPFATALVLVGAVELRRGRLEAARSVAVVALLCVLPLALLIGRQVRRGAWGTVDASRPQERPLLFAVGGAGLLALLAYLAAWRRGSPLVTGVVGTLGMVAVGAAVTPWVKVSLHVAVAALAATVLLEAVPPLGRAFAAALPLLGWSRVALGRHRWVEVAAGLLLGAATGMIVLRVR
jgi:membrane-associated phospholipid phosphatase